MPDMNQETSDFTTITGSGGSIINGLYNRAATSSMNLYRSTRSQASYNLNAALSDNDTSSYIKSRIYSRLNKQSTPMSTSDDDFGLTESRDDKLTADLNFSSSSGSSGASTSDNIEIASVVADAINRTNKGIARSIYEAEDERFDRINSGFSALNDNLRYLTTYLHNVQDDYNNKSLSLLQNISGSSRNTSKYLYNQFQKNTDTPVAQAATGKKVTKSGLVAVSEGEMIIPSEKNPLYNNPTNKKEQIRKEQNLISKFAAGASGINTGANTTNVNDTDVENITQASDSIDVGNLVSILDNFYSKVFSDTRDNVSSIQDTINNQGSNISQLITQVRDTIVSGNNEPKVVNSRNDILDQNTNQEATNNQPLTDQFGNTSEYSNRANSAQLTPEEQDTNNLSTISSVVTDINSKFDNLNAQLFGDNSSTGYITDIADSAKAINFKSFVQLLSTLYNATTLENINKTADNNKDQVKELVKANKDKEKDVGGKSALEQLAKEAVIQYNANNLLSTILGSSGTGYQANVNDLLYYSGSGSGLISQTDPRLSNLTVGGKSMADNGCGPSTAVMALTELGKKANIKDAVNDANKYQTNGGTDASYFANEFAKSGVKADYLTGDSVKESIASGKPTILMGQDSTNKSKNYSPFGPKNHYVVASGFDNNGNVIVKDPESTSVKRYSSKILNNVKLGIGAGVSAISSDASAASAKKEVTTNTTSDTNTSTNNTSTATDTSKLTDVPTDQGEEAEEKSKNPNSLGGMPEDVRKTMGRGYSDTHSESLGGMPEDVRQKMGKGYKGTKEMTRYSAIFQYLKGLGLTDVTASAIMGCWEQESKNNPGSVEGDYLKRYPGTDKVLANPQSAQDYTTNILFPAYANSNPPVSINKRGYKGDDGYYYPGVGLAAWTGPNASKLWKFANEKGEDWKSLAAQLDYFTNGPIKLSSTIGNSMNGMNSLDNATSYFFTQYEMGGNKAVAQKYPSWVSKRQASAHSIYNQYKGTKDTLSLDDLKYVKLIDLNKNAGVASSSSSTSFSSDGSYSSGTTQEQKPKRRGLLSNILGSFSDFFNNIFGLGDSSEDSSTGSESYVSSNDETEYNTSSGPVYGEGATSLRDKFISSAASQIGQVESPKGSNHVVATNGDVIGKVTGADYQPWCASFVSWAMKQAVNGDNSEAKTLLYGPYQAAVDNYLAQFRKNNAIYKQPQPGDLVLYHWTTGGQHVGIVEKDNGDGTMTTIEGNSSDAVVRKPKVAIQNANIVGFGRPKWQAFDSNEKTDASASKAQVNNISLDNNIKDDEDSSDDISTSNLTGESASGSGIKSNSYAGVPESVRKKLGVGYTKPKSSVNTTKQNTVSSSKSNKTPYTKASDSILNKPVSETVTKPQTALDLALNPKVNDGGIKLSDNASKQLTKAKSALDVAQYNINKRSRSYAGVPEEVRKQLNVGYNQTHSDAGVPEEVRRQLGRSYTQLVNNGKIAENKDVSERALLNSDSRIYSSFNNNNADVISRRNKIANFNKPDDSTSMGSMAGVPEEVRKQLESEWRERHNAYGGMVDEAMKALGLGRYSKIDTISTTPKTSNTTSSTPSYSTDTISNSNLDNTAQSIINNTDTGDLYNTSTDNVENTASTNITPINSDEAIAPTDDSIINNNGTDTVSSQTITSDDQYKLLSDNISANTQVTTEMSKTTATALSAIVTLMQSVVSNTNKLSDIYEVIKDADFDNNVDANTTEVKVKDNNDMSASGSDLRRKKSSYVPRRQKSNAEIEASLSELKAICDQVLNS